MGAGTGEWGRLPASVDVGSMIVVRWRPRTVDTKKPVKAKLTTARVVGYHPSLPRHWSEWEIKFLDPEIAKDGHDWNGVGISQGKLYSIDRLPYRTVYEGVLAGCLVGS